MGGVQEWNRSAAGQDSGEMAELYGIAQVICCRSRIRKVHWQSCVGQPRTGRAGSAWVRIEVHQQSCAETRIALAAAEED